MQNGPAQRNRYLECLSRNVIGWSKCKRFCQDKHDRQNALLSHDIIIIDIDMEIILSALLCTESEIKMCVFVHFSSSGNSYAVTMHVRNSKRICCQSIFLDDIVCVCFHCRLRCLSIALYSLLVIFIQSLHTTTAHGISFEDDTGITLLTQSSLVWGSPNGFENHIISDSHWKNSKFEQLKCPNFATKH